MDVQEPRSIFPQQLSQVSTNQVPVHSIHTQELAAMKLHRDTPRHGDSDYSRMQFNGPYHNSQLMIRNNAPLKNDGGEPAPCRLTAHSGTPSTLVRPNSVHPHKAAFVGNIVGEAASP